MAEQKKTSKSIKKRVKKIKKEIVVETPKIEIPAPVSNTISEKLNALKLFIIFRKKFLIVLLLAIVLSTLFNIYKSIFIVATVNGTKISRLNVIKELEARGGKQTLDNLIMRELISQKAKEKNVFITEEQINSEIDKIRENVTKQGADFEQELSAQGLTLDSFKEQLKLQDTLKGIVDAKVQVTEDEINEMLKSALAFGQKDTPELREQIKQQIQQTKEQEEVQAYLDNMRATADIKILNKNYTSN